MAKNRTSRGKRQPQPDLSPTTNGIAKKWAALIIAIAVALFANYRLVAPLKQLPSPIYGGDYYFQLGQTIHVAQGGNPLGSANIEGTLPAYLLTYSYLAGSLASLLDIDAMTAEFILSYLIAAASVVVIFFLVLEFVPDPISAGVVATLFMHPMLMPVVKYTEMSNQVVVPLFLLTLNRFRARPTLTRAAILGVVYGVASISHSVAFIGCSLFLAATFFFDAWRDFKGTTQLGIGRLVVLYAAIAVVGLPIAMLYWWDPIFVHHFKTSPHYANITHKFRGFGEQISHVGRWLSFNFLAFASPKAVACTILRLLGLAALWQALRPRHTKEKDRRAKRVDASEGGIDPTAARAWLFLMVVGLALSFHDIVTLNLFGFHFVAKRMIVMFLPPCLAVLMAMGAYYLYQKLKANEALRHVYYPALVIAVLVVQQTGVHANMAGRWHKKGCTDLPQHYVELVEYLNDNSSITDAILTTKELGFAVNGLSGRKLVLTRRGHNDAFVDMNQRELDAALMLYGSDPELRRTLLKKYDVQFLYWDGYWIQSEFRVSPRGEVLGTFDPISLFYSKEIEEVLRNNDVKFDIKTTWVDPYHRGPLNKKFKLITISPQNYRSVRTPWHSDLDASLEKVWSFDNEGRETACLYRIVVPTDP